MEGYSKKDGTIALVLSNTESEGICIPLQQEITTLGRDGKNHILLDDVTVSRQHCLITKEKDKYTLKDCKSMNGTYLNNERIQETSVQPGDTIQVGKFIFTVTSYN